MFCAGANIRMLGKATHGHKVNFCKFTNETRLAIEDASENSKQIYMSRGERQLRRRRLRARARRPTTSCWSTIAARPCRCPRRRCSRVLPGTGGITRVTDKRKVRRDRADFFCSTEEGLRGTKAVDWRLVDEAVPKSKWEDAVAARAKELAAALRPSGGREGHQAHSAQARDHGQRASPIRMSRSRSSAHAALPR